jgi:vesicle coat complex subunit
MYLVHYADVEPDTILLSINTFQKDMYIQIYLENSDF